VPLINRQLSVRSANTYLFQSLLLAFYIGHYKEAEKKSQEEFIIIFISFIIHLHRVKKGLASSYNCINIVERRTV